MPSIQGCAEGEEITAVQISGKTSGLATETRLRASGSSGLALRALTRRQTHIHTILCSFHAQKTGTSVGD